MVFGNTFSSRFGSDRRVSFKRWWLNQNVRTLSLNADGFQGPLNQRSDSKHAKQTCKRPYQEHTAITGSGNKPILPEQQVRQKARSTIWRLWGTCTSTWCFCRMAILSFFHNTFVSASPHVDEASSHLNMSKRPDAELRNIVRRNASTRTCLSSLWLRFLQFFPNEHHHQLRVSGMCC